MIASKYNPNVILRTRQYVDTSSTPTEVFVEDLVFADGSVPMTGNLDLNGNDLIIDADGDSILHASADDVLQIQTGGVTRVTIQNGSTVIANTASLDGLTNFGDTVDLQGNQLVLDLDGDTSITADTDDQIDFEVGGSDVAVLDATNLDLEVDLDLSGGYKCKFHSTVYIDLNGAELRFVTGASERMHLDSTSLDLSVDIDLNTNDVIAGGTGNFSDIQTIEIEGTSAVSPLVVHGQDASISPADGGDLHLRGGVEQGAANAGEVVLQQPDGTDVLTINDTQGYWENVDLNFGSRALSNVGTLTATRVEVGASDLDMGGNEVILDSDDDTSIRSSADDQIDFKIGGTDYLILTAAKVDVSAADLHIDQGKKLVLDDDDDTYLYSIIDDQIWVFVGGAAKLTLTATLCTLSSGVDLSIAGGDISVNGDITGVSTMYCAALADPAASDIQVNDDFRMQGNRIDLDSDNDTSIRAGADDQIDIEIAGADEYQLTASQFDCTGARIVNFAGRRMAFGFSWYQSNSAGTRWCYCTSFALPGNTGGTGRGIRMWRAGSITGIGINVDVDAYTSGTCGAAAYINNALQFNETFTPPGTGDGQGTQNTYAQGTYTFSAGDVVACARTLSGTATTTNALIWVEVEFDT